MKTLTILTLAFMGLAGTASADSWQVYSRNQNNAFLVEVDGIVNDGVMSTARVATVRRANPAGDYTHSIEVFQFKCADGQWRTAGMTDYGATGLEEGAFPEADAQWEAVRPNTGPEYLKAMVCDGNRAAASFPDIKGYIDAGRP